MACENCENGCVNPNMCACDCASCAEASSCTNTSGGQPGAPGPTGGQGAPGTPGLDGLNGADGLNGCSILDVYISNGSDGNSDGDLIITTGEAPTPCGQIINAGNILAYGIDGGGSGGVGVPSGVICMWSGGTLASQLPSGWVLCNGQNGTPDLRGKFVVGDDSTVSPPATDSNGNTPFVGVGSSGGVLDVQLNVGNIPAHNHSASGLVATMSPSGAHAHKWQGWYSVDGSGSPAEETKSRSQINSDDPEYCTLYNLSGNSNSVDHGAHTHPITITGSIGDGSPILSPIGDSFSTLPNYYVIAYIMKL